MNSKILSEKALTVIDQYTHFKIQNAVTSIPYYNNNHKKIRAALRALVGKGSPKDIFDETEISLIKDGVRSANIGAVQNGSFVPAELTSDVLRKFLVDQNIGIDCSGFAYYVLNAESIARKKGTLDRHLHFPLSKGIIQKIRCKLRPIENTNVRTLAHDKNSRIIALDTIEPGDMITMINNMGGTATEPEKTEKNNEVGEARNHILVINQIEYQNFIPITIHYTHSMAWPTDGEYGHGVRTGDITILDIKKPLTEQLWSELGKTGSENYTLARALNSRTEARRLNWF